MTQDQPARRDVYQTVTDTIIGMIETGAGSFQMPWHAAGGPLAQPTNAATQARYRGVNVVTLWAFALRRGYGAPTWATYRQWRQLGARVRRGEHGAPVVFYRKLDEPEDDTKDDESEADSRAAERPPFVARLSWAFNADQVEGFEPPPPAATTPLAPAQRANRLVAGTRAVIRYGGDRAFYRPTDDAIRMPRPEQFTGTATSSATEAFYATLLHELVHWSGAAHRLDRDLAPRFAVEAYAVEELVAELGAAFLCCELAITPTARRDHAAYIEHWLKVMRADTRAIFTAASKASQAADYLLAFERPPDHSTQV